MTTNPARRLLLLLVVAIAFACRPAAAPPETPPDTAASTKGVPLVATAHEDVAAALEPINVQVSVTKDGTFSVSKDPIEVARRNAQTIVWEAADANVEIEIEYAPAARNPKNPTVGPPSKPCPARARKCGGMRPVGGDPGTFKYTISGTKDGDSVPDFDPEVVILPEP